MARILMSLLLLLTAISSWQCGPSDQMEERAKELYALADHHAQQKDFDVAIEILKNISINFEKTSVAKRALNEIEATLELQKIYEDTRNREIRNSFSRIARALENYKVRFLAYPLAPNDLEKLPAVVAPEWVDAWGHQIYYEPTYSNDRIARHAPDGYVLASFGKSGLPGGDGLDRDSFYMDGKEVESIPMP